MTTISPNPLLATPLNQIKNRLENQPKPRKILCATDVIAKQYSPRLSTSQSGLTRPKLKAVYLQMINDTSKPSLITILEENNEPAFEPEFNAKTAKSEPEIEPSAEKIKLLKNEARTPEAEIEPSGEKIKITALEKEAVAAGKSLKIIQGVATGIAVPPVTAPLDTRQTQLAVLKPGEPTPPLKSAFNNYGNTLKGLIPNKIVSGAVFMGSVSVSEDIVSQFTNNKSAIEVGSFVGASLLEGIYNAPVQSALHKMRLSSKSISFTQTLSEIVRQNGVRSLYRGNGPSTLGRIIYNVAVFPVANKMTKAIEQAEQSNKERTTGAQRLMNTFVSGSVVSAVTCPLTYPLFWVALNQRQQKPNTDNPPLSAIKTAKKLIGETYEKQGLKAACKRPFAGISSTLVRMPIMTGMMLTTMESVKMIYLASLEVMDKPRNAVEDDQRIMEIVSEA